MERNKTVRLGLVVNPIAGLGGSVGLKGTDGRAAVERAIKLGGKPLSPRRAEEALRVITSSIGRQLEVFTAPGEMGENESIYCDVRPVVVGKRKLGRTTAADTKEALVQILRRRVKLVLFAGGDGTALDVFSVVGERVPVLGIPSGVKMHSAVFAVNPSEAGRLATLFLAGRAGLRRSEVMDVDEKAFAHNRLSARVYGFLNVPFAERMVQSGKAETMTSDKESSEEIAIGLNDNMQPDVLYIIGPGTTTKRVMEVQGMKYTLLGVDVVSNGHVVALDANEQRLLELMKGRKVKIVVSPIGGQGFMFGRGNQQISPRVISKVGKDNIIVVATSGKIAALQGRPLLVDTGNSKIDRALRGYIRVLTGLSNEIVYRVA